MKLQCLAHIDRAQRACLEFKRAMADLKGVSETELKHVTFESGAFNHFKDLDLKVGALRSFVFPLEQVHKTPLEEQLKLKDLMCGATLEVGKGRSLMTERWESMAKMLRRELATYHPPEKQWHKFCVSAQDKEKMFEFTKSEKLKAVGKLVPKVKQYKAHIEEHCSESMDTALRQWFHDAGGKQESTCTKKADAADKKEGDQPEGCLSQLGEEIFQTKLALAVGHVCKVAYFKGPKTKDTTQMFFCLW